jgi:hypothetical protein
MPVVVIIPWDQTRVHVTVQQQQQQQLQQHPMYMVTQQWDFMPITPFETTEESTKKTSSSQLVLYWRFDHL